MASIAMNKLKSKLTTRNNFTGRAMDRMTKENLKELFQGHLNYMSCEKTFLQRKFHPAEYLKQLRQHRQQMFAKQKANAPNSNINYDELLKEEEEHDIELQKRFQKFTKTHNGQKPVLVLDVDNTMLYCRFFSEEMQIGDVVTYFASDSVPKNNGKILEIELTLSLEITSSTLIDKVGSERMDCRYWAKNNELLKKYKKKHGVFDYKINDAEIIGCKIRKAEVTGCKVQTHSTSLQLKRDGDIDIDIETNTVVHEVVIDFTQGNVELSKLEPMLERPGMAAVDFIFEGFLIRCRPNLDEFLEYCADDYDVVIYTSANKLIYEGLLEVLHEYVKDQLGRADEEDLLLWSDTLYRDDCTLDYDERGKPFHHKDLTLFGCDLSRLIMVDNSPIVCRGEEPNFILIKDYFGKESMDDELMEVYQLLDAMVDIEGDVRYFLCNLESDDDTTIDLKRESECWSLTQKLMNELDAYYSEQIALSPVEYSDEDEYAQEVDGEQFMDDYDEEDFLDRERITSVHLQSAPIKEDEEDDDEQIINIDNIDNIDDTDHDYPIDTHSAKSSAIFSPQISAPNSPNVILKLNDEASVSTIINITDIDDEEAQKIKRTKVKFTAPSINTKVQSKPDESLSYSQSQKSLSAKHALAKGKKSQSARFGKGGSREHMKRNKSLLLDPEKLDSMTQRHNKYSSMSPRYVLGLGLGVPGAMATVGTVQPKFSFNDLNVNDAIHSFGAVDTDEDEEEDSDFFSQKQLHEQTKSSLTIDTRRYSLQEKKTRQVPQFQGDPTHPTGIMESQSADVYVVHRKRKNSEKKDDHEMTPLPNMEVLVEEKDEIIPPPNTLKLKTMKTLETIKAEKLQKRQKRLSEKRNSSMKLQPPMLTLAFAGRNRDYRFAHRRGLSSDAIGQIDFGANDDVVTKTKPGRAKHKMSIADEQQFGKVWRNTMAPRPSAKSILNASSKHDEFILLFQQNLNEIKRDQLKEKEERKTHNTKMEKRKSVPDFAMLSEIDSENDIIAHRLRLSTLREDQMMHISRTSAILEGVEENKSLDDMNTIHGHDDKPPSTKLEIDNADSNQKLLQKDANRNKNKQWMNDWDKNVSQRHGCCFYFCCCCICNLFAHKKESTNGIVPVNNSFAP